MVSDLRRILSFQLVNSLTDGLELFHILIFPLYIYDTQLSNQNLFSRLNSQCVYYCIATLIKPGVCLSKSIFMNMYLGSIIINTFM